MLAGGLHARGRIACSRKDCMLAGGLHAGMHGHGHGHG
jgi:hypothetical protein